MNGDGRHHLHHGPLVIIAIRSEPIDDPLVRRPWMEVGEHRVGHRINELGVAEVVGGISECRTQRLAADLGGELRARSCHRAVGPGDTSPSRTSSIESSISC